MKAESRQKQDETEHREHKKRNKREIPYLRWVGSGMGSVLLVGF